MIRSTYCAIFLITTVVLLSACNKRGDKPRVLVFTKTSGFVHSSIPVGARAIMKLGAENEFDVDTTRKADIFTDSSLEKYSAVVFLNTTGNLLDTRQEIALERYIQGGGGYVGIHAAADAEYDWGWYGRLVGAYFESHPQIQQASLNITDHDDPSTKHLPAKWTRTDEWYNFKKLNKDVHVLISIDEKSYQGGKNGDNHPMAWYHKYDGGRAFYTELGHTDESYTDPLYLKHLLGGILYAVGDNKKIDYSDAKSQYPPDEDRFTKTILTRGSLTEPTEITVLPNLDVLISQRRGEFFIYKNETKQLKPAGSLNVYWKTETKGVNAEEGLLGIQADPDFKNNSWIYVFYSPADTSVNRLSRFAFKNDKVDLASEKIVLQFYSQRNICCHTGGSIAFGPDKMLYVSTGDNSTPFNEPNQAFVHHGYAPLDDRPGHVQYDARRSAGNTNDLRGKVLRIRVRDDGTYEIPEGNLFAKNTARTRPEIFAMGTRNPYRISVDPKNGYLYWGEVGPDARADSFQTRGPKGYDEINQAKKAGFFGWPLLVGNNYPYREYNYNTGVSGPAIDPENPLNNSLNNTGLKELPAAQPAFIWYSYDNSNVFPQVGSGGRTAMAGPAYYTDMFPKETRYPDYYNKKVFIYEWIRNWIMAVTLTEDGDFDKMEPFMENTSFAAPIDMEMGPDGRLYMLEYGKGWFSKNPEAGISRIDFNSGNRPPKVGILQVSSTTGALPYRVTATIDAKDPEKDKLTYNWDFGNGIKKQTTEPAVDYTYTKAGDYAISVEVADDKKASSNSEAIALYAGNQAPVVDIRLDGNKTFYFPGKAVRYNVIVEDQDDTARVNPASLRVMADFVEGIDKAAVPIGHLSVSETQMGKNLMLAGDCKSCHHETDKSVGPAFTQVALKYRNDPKAVPYLTDKIKKGGGGVWGEVAMSAHPDLPNNDIQQMVRWIMALGNTAVPTKSLAPSGTLQPGMKDKGNLYFTATYTDRGGPGGAKPLTVKQTMILKNNLISMREVKEVKGFTNFDSLGTRYLVTPAGQASLKIDSVDLSGISAVEVMATTRQMLQAGYVFELRLDAVKGRQIGSASLLPPATGTKSVVVRIPMEAVTDNKFHDLYLVSRPAGANESQKVRLQAIKVIGK